MPVSRPLLLRSSAALAIALIADFFANPLPVDAPFTFLHWLSLLLHFPLWLAGLYAWGQFLSHRITGEAPLGLSLAAGSLAYALLAFFLGAVGLLRPELRYLLFLFQACGIALGEWKRPEIKPAVLLAALPLLLFSFLHFADALVISPYWDPLHHHLTSVRLFWEHGGFYFPADNISAYQEGGFELLFLWPHFYFAQAGGRGLLTVQIFSQLTHLFVGFGGALALAYAFAKAWLPTEIWRILAIALFAAPVSLQFGIPTAKNEWGIVLWVLSGFWLLTHGPAERLRSALAGFLWGFAWLAKLSSGFALGALSSLFFFRKRTRNEYLLFALACTLGVLPLALRNLIGTGNPLFPLFPDFFPMHEGAMGPTWREALARYNEAPLGLARLADWRQEFPLALAALLGPVLAFRSSESLSLRVAALAPLVSFLIFSFLAGRALELRLIGAALPLAGLILAALLQRAGQWLPERWNYQTIAPTALLLVVAIYFPYRWEAVARLPAIAHTEQLARAYVSGEAQGWFRDRYDSDMKGALLSETRIYHSLPIALIRLWDSPVLDKKLRATRTPREFLRLLKKEGFTHLIVSSEKLDLFYPRDLVAAVEAYILQRQKAIVFRTNHSFVVELALLPLL